MKALLTDVSVRALPPAPKQTKVWDTKTKGFGVLVSGSTKSFFVSYGRQRNIKTLGRYRRVFIAAAVFIGVGAPALNSSQRFGDWHPLPMQVTLVAQSGRSQNDGFGMSVPGCRAEIAQAPVHFRF
jgi:hypothetical protein